MIRKADEKDLNTLYTLYSNTYPRDYVEYFFDYEYKPFDMYLTEDAEGISSAIFGAKETVRIQNYPIQAVVLKNAIRNANMRNEENQRALLKEILEEISYQNLLVLVEPKGNDIYKKMGFEPYCVLKQYTIYRNQVPVYPTGMIYENYEEADLLRAYEAYASHFDGYPLRDVNTYVKKRAYNDAMNYRTLAYYSSEHVCEGYVVFDINEDPIRIVEIVYLNSVAFLKLISYLLNLKDCVEFTLTPQENIVRMIPTAIGKTKAEVWGKIMDYSLFNRLLQTKYSTLNDLLEGSRKPFLYHE